MYAIFILPVRFVEVNNMTIDLRFGLAFTLFCIIYICFFFATWVIFQSLGATQHFYLSDELTTRTKRVKMPASSNCFMQPDFPVVFLSSLLNAFSFLLHGELPQRRHGGEHLLNEIFYAGNSKWLNVLQFYKRKKSKILGSRHL